MGYTHLCKLDKQIKIILYIVGGWRLDEYGGGNNTNCNGLSNNIHHTSNGISNGMSNGVSNGGGGGGGAVSSCVIHAMPHVCWCEVCSKGLCRACSQVMIYILLIMQLNNFEIVKVKLYDFCVGPYRTWS